MEGSLNYPNGPIAQRGDESQKRLRFGGVVFI